MRKCKFCGKETGIFLREHRLALCETCYPSWIEKQVSKTIKKFNMIKPDDKVLVAVSGGKDSLSLIQVLKRLGYNVSALYIDLKIKHAEYSSVSREKVVNFCNKTGIELYIVDLEDEGLESIDRISKIYRKTCSACGAIKRYYMNKICLEKGFNVIATGHNMDDEVTTLFGNLIQWDKDYLKRQYPVMPQNNLLAKKIKPFVFISERQSAMYAIVNGIDYIREECPYSKTATSISYKEVLSMLEYKHPGILRFFLNNFFESKNEETKLENVTYCKTCGAPSYLEVCKVCKIKEKLNKK